MSYISAGTETSPSIMRPASGLQGVFGALATVSRTPIICLNFNYAINSYFTTTTTANAGTVTQANSSAVLQTGTNAAGSAVLESKAACRYNAGEGVYASFSAAFTTGVANSRQAIGLGDANDGIFFGYSGTTFGVFRRSGGSDTFVAQSSWNGVDKFDGTGPSGVTLDPTKLNVFKIQLSWHGSGPIIYSIYNPADGQIVKVHTILYGNTATVPSMANPTLPLRAETINSGSTTNLTVKTSSMGAYIEGDAGIGSPPLIGAPASKSNTKATSTTEGNVLTLKNLATNVLGGTNTNRTRIRITSLSLQNTSGAQDISVRLVLNTTLGGSPSYTNFDTNTSVAATDTAGTTLTGGREIFNARIGTGNNLYIELRNLDLQINPGDILTVAATSASATPTVYAALTWLELF